MDTDRGGGTLDDYREHRTLILSCMPFALLKRLIHKHEEHATPPAAHWLGRC